MTPRSQEQAYKSRFVECLYSICLLNNHCCVFDRGGDSGEGLDRECKRSVVL